MALPVTGTQPGGLHLGASLGPCGEWPAPLCAAARPGLCSTWAHPLPWTRPILHPFLHQVRL